MKKIFGLLAISALLLAFAGCGGKKKIETVSGVLKGATDTTVTMIIDQNKVVFDTKECRFTNGVVMTDDSVKIDYVGDLGDKKATALIIHLFPKQGHWVSTKYDPTKKLLTRPASAEDVENMNKFVEEAKKHGH